MNAETELKIILGELNEIRSRLSNAGGKRDFALDDASRVKRLLIEAKALTSGELGGFNDFSREIAAVHARAVSSPSPGHVVDTIEYITGALNHMRRERDRARGQVNVPASDRYVTPDDNSRHDLAADLSELTDAVRGANDFGEEDRTVVLSEIAIFEATLVQPRVPTDLIERFVDRVLTWLVRVFAGATASEVAQRLIIALAALAATAG